MYAGLLDVLQIADSAFPSGSYAHSLGLEALYGTGGVVDLEAHLRFVLINGLTRVELPVVREAHLADDDADLLRLDALMDVLLPVSEFRQASRSVGRSFLRAAARVRPCPTRVQHHAVAFGAVIRAWELDIDAGLEVYAWGAVRQQLSAAQRLGKIGQSALQALLHSLKPAVHAAAQASWAVPLTEIGGFAPLLDVAGMDHAQQSARLFLS